MQDAFMTQVAETAMAVYNFNLFANDNVSKDGEEGEDSREGRLAVDDPKRHMVDFQAIRQVPNACPTGIRMGYDYDFVAAVDQLLVYW